MKVNSQFKKNNSILTSQSYNQRNKLWPMIRSMKVDNLNIRGKNQLRSKTEAPS